MQQTEASKHQETAVQMLLDRWFAQVKNFDATLGALTDADLYRHISPGKNRGIYLLGHLIAVHEDMLSLLDFGGKSYPQLKGLFITSPDNVNATYPSPAELRSSWNKVNGDLEKKIRSLSPEEWFEKHTAVSQEDFLREPHRNKLNIIVTRTSHLSYHLGQINLLKK
jgi:hypothetical protein